MSKASEKPVLSLSKGVELTFGAVDTVPEVEIKKAIVIPDQSEILALLQKLQSTIEVQSVEIAALKAAAPTRVQYEDDMTESLFFLARPNGEPWEERVFIDGKTVLREGRRTAFYGPFESEEQIEAYLTAKRKKRLDSVSDWETVKTMTGKAARQLRYNEKHDIRRNLGGTTAMNILDKRMRPALDLVTGNMDRIGQVGVAIAAKDYA